MILGLITATVASTSAIELFTAGSVAAVALFTGTTNYFFAENADNADNGNKKT